MSVTNFPGKTKALAPAAASPTPTYFDEIREVAAKAHMMANLASAAGREDLTEMAARCADLAGLDALSAGERDLFRHVGRNIQAGLQGFQANAARGGR